MGTWHWDVPKSQRIPGLGRGMGMSQGPGASLGGDRRMCDPLTLLFPPKSGFSLVMNHPACVNEITLSLNNKNAR